MALGLGGRIPTWARWLVSVMLVCVVIVMSVFLLQKPTSPAPTPDPTPVTTMTPIITVTPTSASTPAILLTEDASTLIERPTVYSAYISTRAPTVDGILTPGEWPEPAFTKTFDYTVEDTKKTGDMNGYFMNDEDFLYAAITVSADDFKENILEEEVGFWSLNLWFDGDNDGIIGIGNDIARFWRSMYSDSHIGEEGYEVSDVKLNGFGACNFSPGNRTYVYEFQIQLDSGDPEDLAVKPGDTIGIKVVLVEWVPSPSVNHWNRLGSVGWPIGQGVLDGSKYGKLALAAKPIVPTASY